MNHAKIIAAKVLVDSLRTEADFDAYETFDHPNESQALERLLVDLEASGEEPERWDGLS